MADGEVVIDSRLDSDGVDNGVNRIKAKLAMLNTSLLKTAKISSIITLGSSLIPMLASATTATMGLAASLAAAGVAAGAFGAVAVSALGEVFEKSKEVEELEKKVAEASTTKERVAAQKELNEALAGMTDHQKETMKQLNEFKSFWSGFVDMFEPTVFAAFNYGLEALQKLLSGMTPAIEAVAQIVEDLMLQLNTTIDAGGFQRFFDWLSTNGAEALRSFLIIAGNVFAGLFYLFEAFAPIGASMEEGLIDMTEKFKTWASELQNNPGFKAFIEYAQENGPILLETIGNIIDFVKDLVVALAPLGAEVLEWLQWLTDKMGGITPFVEEVVQAALDFVAAIKDNWPAVKEAVIGVSTAVAAFVIIMKGLQIIGIINTLMTAYRAGTLLATAAQMGLNLAMLANPITWVVLLIAALIAIGVLLYRNWDTVKEKCKELWATIKEKWNAMKEAVGEAMGKIWDKVKEIWDKVVGFFKGIDLKQIGKDIIQGLINGIADMAGKLWDKAKEIAGGVGKAIGKALEVKSPSRLTMRIGVHTGEGLEIGMEKKEKDIEKMSNRLAIAATPNMTQPFNSVQKNQSTQRQEQPAVIQIVTPDNRTIAKWVTPHVTEFQEFDLRR